MIVILTAVVASTAATVTKTSRGHVLCVSTAEEEEEIALRTKRPRTIVRTDCAPTVLPANSTSDVSLKGHPSTPVAL